MHYTDFVLLASESRIIKAEGKKRLTFNLFAPGVFNDAFPRELNVLEFSDLKEKASSPDAGWSDARALGEALANVLLPPHIWNALNNQLTQAAAANEGIRVRLMLTGAELNNWPWEFMVFNRAGGETKISDFLALMPNVSIVRHTATPLPAWRVEAKVPARVLVAVASPRTGGWPKLKVTEELSVVEKALKGCAQLSVSSLEHARRGQLPDKANPAHLFHFAGHGKFEEVQSAVAGAYEGNASIILEDEYGDQDPLDAGLLALQLRDAGVRVAVLGACQTAQRDDLNAWSSVAEALLKAELGAVVGMQFPILDTSALLFAERFYGVLAVGLGIDEAVAAGRIAVAAAGDARGWTTPVLYLRSPDGVIFREFASDTALETARVKASQEIDVLRDEATNVRIAAMTLGHVEADQHVKVVEKGASLENVAIGTMTGGAVDAKQKLDEVKGKAVNVSIDTLGPGGGSVRATADVREVRGGANFTGVKIGGNTTRTSRPSKTKLSVPKQAAARTRAGEPAQVLGEQHTVDSKINVGNLTGGQVIGNIVVADPEVIKEIVRTLMESQGIDLSSIQAVMARAAPEDVSRQISAVVSAQRQQAASGATLDSKTAYYLGMLAAYKRDYDTAISYFRQATQADPECREAFAALSWLQQSRAMSDLDAGNFDAVVARLAEAREAAIHTDPLSASDMAQRGYIYKTLAQLAESRHQKPESENYYCEAARLFEQATKLDPYNAGAQNGLGNVLHLSGDLDGGISAYRRAIKLEPAYTAAHYDLALAFEQKIKAEPPAAKKWRERAIKAWQEAYRLAPDDPGFSANDVLAIGQRIASLKRQQDG